MVFSKLFDEAQKQRKNLDEKKAGSKVKAVSTLPQNHSKGKNRGGSTNPSNESKPRTPRKRPRSRNNKEEDPRANKRRNFERDKRHPPSEAALRFSAQLKDLSRQKRLDQALKLYWEKSYDSVRDEHHACIMVDCCSRCGSVNEAEKIVNEFENKRGHVNAYTQTALLKGYAHSGESFKAESLFWKMCAAKNKRDLPNVRTLNTLLRGCLWTAATKKKENPFGGKNKVAGGVVTSEKAWKMFKNLEFGEDQSFDASSYEYSVTLLCQALRTEEAQQRISELQSQYNIKIKGKASIIGGDQAVLETLGASYLGLARAYALLGQSEEMWLACQRVLSSAKASRVHMGNGNDDSNKKDRKKRGAQGGKRSWRKSDDGGNDSSAQRISSNTSYRNHKLSELEAGARSLLKNCGKKSKPIDKEDLMRQLLLRLFYFSGGGTTQLSPSANVKHTADQSLYSCWSSFGLSHVVDDKTRAKLDLSLDSSFDGDRLYKLAKLSKQPLEDDGSLDFKIVFPEGDNPVDIELGAGFGDWIVQQARSNPSRNYIGVELRADRVFQMFAKASLESSSSSAAARRPLSNVCVVGAECGSFLGHRVKGGTISAVFANHPEPPTQLFGGNQADLQSIMDGGPEPGHMLNSNTLLAAAKCLKPNGRIVIVTDNRWYASLLCGTMVKVLHNSHGDNGKHRLVLQPPERSEMEKSGLKVVETFRKNVTLYQGQPNASIGHSASSSDGGASYFDRLWRTGAGSHSERRTRFVVVMCSRRSK